MPSGLARLQRFDGDAVFAPHTPFRFGEPDGGGAGPKRHGSLALEQAVDQFVRQAARPEQVVGRPLLPPGPVLLPRLALLLLTSLLVLDQPPGVLDRSARWSFAVAHSLLP